MREKEKEKVWIVFRESPYTTEILGVFKTPNKGTYFLNNKMIEDKYYTIYKYYMEDYEIQ